MVFTYHEILTKEELKLLPKEFSLNGSIFKEIALIRMLSGTADLKYVLEDKTIPLRKNLNNTNGKENKVIKHTAVTRNISPIKPKEFIKYLQANRSYNSRLIDDLLFEFSYYFMYTEKGNHTSAFIHLYRIIEFISYSFPLIHASNSKNFSGTFSSLQSYFSKEGGEFEFIKKFILKLFQGDSILDFPFEFQVKAPSLAIQNCIYTEYKKILGSSGINAIYDPSALKISIQARDLIEATRFLRNRYFHFAIGSGQKNIKASEIMYPDIFFEQINPLIANWWSLIYFELMIGLAEKWSK